jgi:hypothetical protein
VIKRVTNFLLQKHQNLFEPLSKLAKGNGAPQENSLEIACGTPLTLGNLLKGLKLLLELPPKGICLPLNLFTFEMC